MSIDSFLEEKVRLGGYVCTREGFFSTKFPLTCLAKRVLLYFSVAPYYSCHYERFSVGTSAVLFIC